MKITCRNLNYLRYSLAQITGFIHRHVILVLEQKAPLISWSIPTPSWLNPFPRSGAVPPVHGDRRVIKISALPRSWLREWGRHAVAKRGKHLGVTLVSFFGIWGIPKGGTKTRPPEKTHKISLRIIQVSWCVSSPFPDDLVIGTIDLEFRTFDIRRTEPYTS